jgi:hypothetical protein
MQTKAFAAEARYIGPSLGTSFAASSPQQSPCIFLLHWFMFNPSDNMLSMDTLDCHAFLRYSGKIPSFSQLLTVSKGRG